MHQGRTVFSQVMDFFPEREFQRIVGRYEGNKWVQSFTCRSHFKVMAFAQLTGRESLRDIETCLAANSRHLHLGRHPDQGVAPDEKHVRCSTVSERVIFRESPYNRSVFRNGAGLQN